MLFINKPLEDLQPKIAKAWELFVEQDLPKIEKKMEELVRKTALKELKIKEKK